MNIPAIIWRGPGTNGETGVEETRGEVNEDGRCPRRNEEKLCLHDWCENVKSERWSIKEVDFVRRKLIGLLIEGVEVRHRV